MGMNAEELRSTGTGDWLKQLKNILQLGDNGDRDFGDNPKAEHRSTVTAVKLLLSNLRTGLRKKPDDQTSTEDQDFVLFNAIDRLIRDKVEKSKKNKTLLQSVAKFELELEKEFAKQSGKKNSIDGEWLVKAKESLKALRIEEYEKDLDGKNQDELELVLDPSKNHPLEKRELCVRKMLASEEGKQAIASKTHVSIQALEVMRDPDLSEELLSTLNRLAFSGDNFLEYAESLGEKKDEVLGKILQNLAKQPLPKDESAQREAKTQALAFLGMANAMDPKAFADVGKKMLKSKATLKRIKENPKLGGALLSSIDPKALEETDFDLAFGDQKNDVLGEAMLNLSQKKPPSDRDRGKPPFTLDPKLFKVLVNEVPPDVWNNKTATTGVLKGLGARICMELWNAGGYEQAAELIEHGVDTSLATRVTEDVKANREGFYSGFVQPLEHIVAKYLSDVDKLGGDDSRDWTQEYKSKVEGAKKIFESLGEDACSLTKWSDVKNCDMIAEFKNAPGTIWGFEDVRGPYVQAAHETDQGSRPLRMWELWDAIGLTANSYEELLNDPKGFAEKQVKAAAKTIQEKKSTRVNYDHIQDLDAFVDDFKKSAKALLLEFAAQLPKGTYASVSKTAGFEEGKFIGALSCKAGLWLAKEKEEPVYYCLDGINMEDVTNYKKVKNTAIDDFLSGKSKKKHDEVITMVEVREILKHWDELKDKEGNPIVKFVVKGKILTGEDLKEKVQKWQQDMLEVDQVNPTPAPAFTKFTTQLDKIDKELLNKLQETAKLDVKQANRDGLAIVKKHGYLVKLANTRPHVAIKYIMAKCDVLKKYELVSDDLPGAAREFHDVCQEEELNEEDIQKAAERLRTEIMKCHADFRSPLAAALLRHPVTDEPL